MCVKYLRLICFSGVQNHLGNSMASLTSGIHFLQLPPMPGRRHSLNKLSGSMSGSRVSLARGRQLGTKDVQIAAQSQGIIIEL